MIKILADADLPGLRIYLSQAFTLSLYHSENELRANIANADVLICRSTLKVNALLLEHTSIQCIATASSGTDHIDAQYLASRNITLFDAKGSNAQAVADYVTATLAWLDLNYKTTGKNAGLIGAGAVGKQVLQRLISAGYHVVIYDPYQTQTGSIMHAQSLTELQHCDLITIHPNLHDDLPYPSRNLINEAFLAKLKPGVTLINASRGGIVNENDLLTSGKPISYCTDVFSGEPTIDPKVVEFTTLCTPHIAGHSVEAKLNAIKQLSVQLHQHFDLPLPFFPIENELEFCMKKGWEAYVLDLYTPFTDTQILKSATDKRAGFLTQRRTHLRHHFKTM